MISGTVNARRQPLVSLTLRGPQGAEVTISVIVDTGYNGPLTLPADQIETLGLPQRRSVTVSLADGSSQDLPVYQAFVDWDGVERNTRVLASDAPPLLGMSLVLGHRLIVDMVDGGTVTIERLP